MAGRRFDSKDKPDSRKADATVADSMRVPDPRFDKISSFFSSADKLPAIKKKLGSCAVLHNDTKVVFDNFVANLRGMGRFSIGGVNFVSLRTRGSNFLLCDRSAENLYEVSTGLMDVDLKRRLILQSNGGKFLYLYLVTSEEIERMAMLAAKDKKQEDKNTLVHNGANGPAVDFDSFVGKLKNCTFLGGTEDSFDVLEFAASVQFAITYEDTLGNPYYYIIAGKENDGYRLYVDRPTHDLDSFQAMHMLSFNQEMCKLFRED
ncbi:hypothetical protein GF318_05085 [Candidatus Micrarchaeota archaeon]|nr:hypothetical protein [Candidatus Micrarchaeota archaeon]